VRDRYVVLLLTSSTVRASTVRAATRLAERSHAVLLFLLVRSARRGAHEGGLYASTELTDRAVGAWLRSLESTDLAVSYRHRVAQGDPVQVVAELAESVPVELVVTEDVSRGWLPRMIAPSVSERLVRALPCPVVVAGPSTQHGVRLDATAHRRHGPPARPVLESRMVADLLGALVDARVKAVRLWMDDSAERVARIAASETVATVLAQEHASETTWDQGRVLTRLHVELEEHRRAMGAVGWELRSAGRTLSNGPRDIEASAALDDFHARIERDGWSTSLPVRLRGAKEQIVVLAGARVSHRRDAMLVFALDAELDFLRVLGQPGPLPSLETYAFDEDGLMLSNSRFADYLCDTGLLPGRGLQTPLRLRVAEPSQGPCERWPLTRMAVQCTTRHSDGLDVHGYPDYRGKPVVGAWRWVERYGFGVVAEVDRVLLSGAAGAT